VIQIFNVGEDPLDVTSITVSGAGFARLPTPNVPFTVAGGEEVDVTVRFSPTDISQGAGTITIRSTDLCQPSLAFVLNATVIYPDIDVPPDLVFAPEVIQSAGACSTLLPFPISNKGQCDLTITSITIGGADAGDFGLSALPSFPIILEPGHIVGEGGLNVVFAPTAIARARTATISVTYVSDALTGATTTITRALCGEGVLTGARVLVMQGGVPVPLVEKIELQRIGGKRDKGQLEAQDVTQNLDLVTVTPMPPCEPFQYHREYGTVSNPVQLLPGSYVVTASAIIHGKRKSLTVGFDVSTCDFNPTIVINF